jgi:hypothetical protein
MWVKKHLEGVLWLTAFGSLVLAAQASTRAYLMVIAGIFVISTAIVLPLHFFVAWRRLRTIPNKRSYAFWVGLESLFAGGLVIAVVLSTR